MTDQPMFEMAPDTRLLRQTLAKASIDDFITYDALSAVISKPVNGGTHALQSARNSLLRRERMVFGVIRGSGLKRLNDTDIVSASEQDVVGIRRKAKMAVRKLTSVQDYNAMPADKRLAHTVKMAVYTAVADISTERSMEVIEKASVGRSSALPFQDTIRAFLP